MNDFERQLSDQPLRPPPPAWRAEILAGAAKIVAPSWTWRDWFWPSPIAWGALAAVWVGAFVLSGSEASSMASAPDSRTAVSAAPPLYAFASPREISALLDSLH
jgi:hypothetical protein